MKFARSEKDERDLRSVSIMQARGGTCGRRRVGYAAALRAVSAGRLSPSTR